MQIKATKKSRVSPLDSASEISSPRAISKLADLRHELLEAATRKRVDKNQCVHQQGLVRVLCGDSRLLSAISDELAHAHVQPSRTRKLSTTILTLCDETLARFTDPESGLSFPIAPPGVSFSRRKDKPTIRQFVLDEWPEHMARNLLFLEDIFRSDYTCWRACRYQAKLRNVPVHVYANDIGIVSKPVIQADPKTYAKQIVIFKAIDSTIRAAAFFNSRQALLATLSHDRP